MEKNTGITILGAYSVQTIPKHVWIRHLSHNYYDKYNKFKVHNKQLLILNTSAIINIVFFTDIFEYVFYLPNGELGIVSKFRFKY